jgi:hypothetical protein
MSAYLHTASEVNDAADLAGITNVDECRTGAGWLP